MKKMKLILMSLLMSSCLVGCLQKQSVDDEINVYDYYSGQQREETDYLWEKENIPTVTNYTENIRDYFDVNHI